MPRRLVLFLFLSSAFYILSFPNFNFSWLAWVALVPLTLFAIQVSPRQAFFGGWLSGTLAYSGILYWIIVTFRTAHLSMALSIFSLLLLAGYLGLYWGAWAWLLTKAHSGAPLHFSLFAAAAWVALEYLRTYLFSGFPWALLADSQVKVLPLIQVASITGIYGVSFLIVFINLSIAQWRMRPALMALGFLCLTWIFGIHRLRTFSHAPPAQTIRVALLQGNIDQYKKWNKAYVEDIERTYAGLTDDAARSKPDIILWPETSVPGYLLQEPALRHWLESVVRKSHTTHLIGAPVIHDEKAYNSAFSLSPEGVLEGEYAKHHLVPFGEIVPWADVLGRFIKVLNELGGFAAGERSAVVNVAGYPIGVNICYEAIFPNLVRQSVKDGAVLIANLTNDGWYMQTSEPSQHWAPNIFRAIENGRWLVRADNTGISGIIDPTGHVIASSPIFTSGVITGNIEPRSDQTPYTRCGDVFAWVCCAITIAFLLRQLTHHLLYFHP